MSSWSCGREEVDIVGQAVFVSYCHAQGNKVWDRLVPCLRAGVAAVHIDRQRFAVARRDCLAHGFLICCRATWGQTNTPSWRINTGHLRPCALREPPHPATEVPLCRTEAMTGWP
jgi:hypothetical protein